MTMKLRTCVVALVISVVAVLVILSLFGRVSTRDRRPEPAIKTGRVNKFGTPVRNSTAVAEDDGRLTFVPLTPQQIAGVTRFVLFIGYPGSGHSIVGSLMDAHPQMVISHEFSLLMRLAHNPQHLATKAELFNALYRDSYNDLKKGWRSSKNMKKGYTLGTGSKWQARFTDLKVIGDKSGGTTTRLYYSSPDQFDRSYQNLLETVRLPICVVHVVRNPYDMAATGMLYFLSHEAQGVKYHDANATHRYNDTTMLEKYLKLIVRRARANAELMRKYHMHVLEIHNSELVLESKATCKKICMFVGVACPDSYLQECSDKAFKEVSKTRNFVVWSQELLDVTRELIRDYPFFHRYSFDSN